METDKPRRVAGDSRVPAEMADEPRRAFTDPRPFAEPGAEPGAATEDPDVPLPLQEEADEPRKRPSV
jgi:hypothetical protein